MSASPSDALNSLREVEAAKQRMEAAREEREAAEIERKNAQQEQQNAAKSQRGQYNKSPNKWQRFKDWVKKTNSDIGNATNTIGNRMSQDISKLRGMGAGIFIFFIVTLTIHIFDYRFSAINGYARIFIYIILGFIGYLIFKGTGGRVLQTITLITLANIFMPELIQRLPRAGLTSLSFAVLFAPFWGIYIYSKTKDYIKIINLIGTLYILICLVLFINYMIGEHPEILGGQSFTLDSIGATREFGKQFADFWNNFWDSTIEFIISIPKTIQNWINESMEYATGGYYHGQEEQVAEPLGVFLEDVEPTAEEYFVGDTVTVWATLKAKNIGKEPIKTKVDCGIDNWWEDLEEPSISIEPDDEFYMEGYDEVDIDCSVDEPLPEGYYDFSINATFDFETDARLLTYWMDKERYRAVTRQGKDIFDEYDIPEEEPIAEFSSGPVAIGIGLGKPPILIGENYLRPRFGATIRSNWQRGFIYKVESFELMVPKELELDIESCSEEVEPAGIEEDMRVYKVVNVEDLENIENYHTVSCRFAEVNKNVLDPTPITLKYMKARAKYTYVIDKTIEIDVKCPPDGCEEGVDGDSELGSESSSSIDESNKDCSGIENNYKYECVPKNIPNSCSGEILERKCQAGTICCKTKITQEETEYTDCASKGCCERDFEIAYCVEDCENKCEFECVPGYCSGPADRQCCVYVR